MRVIPHAEQRYDTIGDYWEDPDGTWQIRVSDLGDWRYNFSVMLHEFVEFAAIQARGVPESEVLAFDLASDWDDPGFDPEAPYHWEHVLADSIERLVSIPLGTEIADMEAAAASLPPWKPADEVQ